jgi:cell migration-inducing and hyaluronan-binding protein
LANWLIQDKIKFRQKTRGSILREGIDIMRMQPRRLLLSWLLPSTLLLGIGVEAGAQDAHAHMDMPAQGSAAAGPASRWSDPASWPDGKVPAAGDAVTIARDRNIVLDVTPPALRSLTVNGKLSFAGDRDT